MKYGLERKSMIKIPIQRNRSNSIPIFSWSKLINNDIPLYLMNGEIPLILGSSSSNRIAIAKHCHLNFSFRYLDKKL